MTEVTQKSLPELVSRLKSSRSKQLSRSCHAHGINMPNGSIARMIEALESHSSSCQCPITSDLPSDIDFAVDLVLNPGTPQEIRIPVSAANTDFSFTLERVISMPSAEAMVDALSAIDSVHIRMNQLSNPCLEMKNGNDALVGMLFANDHFNQIEVDGMVWWNHKPRSEEDIDGHSFAVAHSTFLNESDARVGDEIRWGLCQFGKQMWLFCSDNEEWTNLGEITRSDAVSVLEDMTVQFRHSDDYFYELSVFDVE